MPETQKMNADTGEGKTGKEKEDGIVDIHQVLLQGSRIEGHHVTQHRKERHQQGTIHHYGSGRDKHYPSEGLPRLELAEIIRHKG